MHDATRVAELRARGACLGRASSGRARARALEPASSAAAPRAGASRASYDVLVGQRPRLGRGLGRFEKGGEAREGGGGTRDCVVCARVLLPPLPPPLPPPTPPPCPRSPLSFSKRIHSDTLDTLSVLFSPPLSVRCFHPPHFKSDPDSIPVLEKRAPALRQNFNELVMQGRLAEIGEINAGEKNAPALKSGASDPDSIPVLAKRAPALRQKFNELVMQGRLAEIGEINAGEKNAPALKSGASDPDSIPVLEKRAPALRQKFNELVMQGRLAEIGEINAGEKNAPALKSGASDPDSIPVLAKRAPALRQKFNELVMQGRLAEIGEINAGEKNAPALKSGASDPDSCPPCCQLRVPIDLVFRRAPVLQLALPDHVVRHPALGVRRWRVVDPPGCTFVKQHRDLVELHHEPRWQRVRVLVQQPLLPAGQLLHLLGRRGSRRRGGHRSRSERRALRLRGYTSRKLARVLFGARRGPGCSPGRRPLDATATRGLVRGTCRRSHFRKTPYTRTHALRDIPTWSLGLRHRLAARNPIRLSFT